MNYIFRILLLSFLLTSCGGSDNSDTEGPKLLTKLILKNAISQESNTFSQGKSIELFLKLTNNSNEAITLNFNSGKQYDFYISSSANTEVWRWSNRMSFIQSRTELVIPEGKSIEVSEVWNQKLSGDETISIGSYTAFGSFLDQSPKAQVDFTIH